MAENIKEEAVGRPKKTLQRLSEPTWRRSKLERKSTRLKNLASVTSRKCWKIFEITVNNILPENKKISGEVMEFKTTVQKQKAELSAIKGGFRSNYKTVCAR